MVLSLMSIIGPFNVATTREVANEREAFAIVQEHAASHGMTRVKIVENSDCDSVRYTATTPNGRAGRNIAFLDW